MSERDPETSESLPAPPRERLVRRLAGLIAVLQVALVRVRADIEKPDADLERLDRAHRNLARTLGACRRAKERLERGEGAFPPTSSSSRPGGRAMTYRDYVEFRNLEEFERFRNLPPVRREEVRGCDLEDLAGRFSGP